MGAKILILPLNFPEKWAFYFKIFAILDENFPTKRQFIDIPEFRRKEQYILLLCGPPLWPRRQRLVFTRNKLLLTARLAG